MSKNPTVTIYTTPACASCRLVKQYFEERHLPFTKRDVTRDRAAATDLRRLGVRGVPATVIEQEAVFGFDPYRFDDLLKARGALPD